MHKFEEKDGDTTLRRASASDVVAAYRAGERNFVRLDLSGANLSGLDLRGASFFGSCLTRADLSNAELTHAQFKAADLRGATLAGSMLIACDLIGADFSDANLSRVDFTGSILLEAVLVGADLESACFATASLNEANTTGAKLSNAMLFKTWVCDSDVSAFCDAKTLLHAGPSSVDARTVLKSRHHPQLRRFMIDCGVPSLFAEFMIDCARASNDDLLTSLMQSTFISYGGPDEAFARKLHDALREHGVLTFFFPESATVGERIEKEVYRRLQEHDRVVLVCSEKSLDRRGVLAEIQETLSREIREGGATYLLPIMLDDYVLTGWQKKEPILAERICSRIIADFRGARRSKARFDQALNRLVEALKKKRPPRT